MEKWFAVSIVTILMVTVWVVFISVVIQGEGNTAVKAGRLTEKTVNVEFKRHLLEENELISGIISTSRESIKDKKQTDQLIESSEDNKMREGDLVGVAKLPKVKNGDAIGYGEGISIDDLLTQSSDNN